MRDSRMHRSHNRHHHSHQAAANNDDDDDDLVFYKEQPVLPTDRLFFMSQASTKNNPTATSQSQDDSFGDEDNNKEESSSTTVMMAARSTNRCTIISRRERRKRRHEWRERQLVEQEQEQEEEDEEEEEVNTPPEVQEVLPMEDTFASLQSLLETSQGSSSSSSPPSCSSQQQTVEEKENHQYGTTLQQNHHFEEEEEEEGGVKTNSSIDRKEKEVLKVVTIDQQQQNKQKEQPSAQNDYESDSSTDFDNFQNNDDDDEEEKELSMERHKSSSRLNDNTSINQSRSHIGESSSSSSSRPRRRQNKMQCRRGLQNMEKIRKRASSLSQQVRPQVDFLSASMASSSSSSSSSNKRKTRSSQSIPSILPHNTTAKIPLSVTETQNNLQSIVGSRPMHWKRENTRGATFLNSDRRDGLGKKIRFSSIRKTLQPASTTNLNSARLSKKYFPNRHKTAMTRTSPPVVESSMQTKATPTPPLNFAPAFMAGKSRVRHSKDDQVVEDNSSQERESVFISPNNSNFTSPPPKTRRRNSRGGSNLGSWGRKLGTIQSSRSSDALRIQNQAFCRQATFDINGPRKRAKSHTDITILGNCSRHWMKGTEDSQFSVLAYVHCHTPRKEPGYNLHDNELAWVTFTIATARSVNLQRGKQIRLYNAVMIPSGVCTTINGLTIESLKSNICQRILISTWLCETHPGGLDEIATLSFAPVGETSVPP